MDSLTGLWARIYLCVALIVAAVPGLAAPYAAHVMDARTGETLFEKNSETRLHPASLTKMLTLYIAFEAIERGEITLDTRVTISAHAASQPPSRLGLKAGQRVALRYLIRAAAIKSANDAATAIGEAISGSEAKFANRMNRTAKALGMRNSTFKNANGLTAPGHLSTARDMSVLGRRLFYDFPQYYNIFSRRSADAGLAQVNNTNRRFLDSYEGADGIKTGYTVAAGFNLTASAQRGNKRIIATVFGGTSTANRNAKMADLLDIGFGEAPRNAPVDPPDPPLYAEGTGEDEEVAAALASASAAELEDSEGEEGSAGKTIRLVTTLATSPRPRPRPAAGAAEAAAVAAATPAPEAPVAAPTEADAAAAVVLAMEDVIEGAVAQATAPLPFQVVDGEAPAAAEAEAVAAAVAETPVAPAAPAAPEAAVAAAEAAPAAEAAVPFEVVDAPQAGEALPFALVDAEGNPVDPPGMPQEASIVALMAPKPRPAAPDAPALPEPEVALAEPAPEPEAEPEVAILRPAPAPGDAPLVEAEPEVVTRISTSGGRHWGVSLGEFAARAPAERVLMKTMLAESGTLGEGLRKIVQRSGGYDATILGLSEDQAAMACRRLRARAMECSTIGP